MAPTDPAAWLRRRAILCVLASSASFAIASALVKAVAGFPTVEIMLFRSVFALLLMMPLLWRAGGLAALQTRQPWAHAMRTAAGFAGMFGSYYGYAHLPLATVTALGFAMPIVLGALSIPMLGERITAVRAFSIAAGLLGVLVVLRPWQAEGAVEFGPACVVVAGVVAWALAMVSIRRMGQSGERNITIVMWFAIASTLFSGLCSIPVWVTPSWSALLALSGVGVVSCTAQLLMTEGYRSGEATMLAPFEYGAIIYTVLLGFVIWDEIPGVWEASGILFLIVAGLFAWWREAVSRSPRAPIGPAPAAPSRPGCAASPPSPPIPAQRLG